MARVDGPGQHDVCTLKLARGLKLDCGLGLDAARPWFARWWAEAKPHCRDRDDDAAMFKWERAFETADCPLRGAGLAQRMLDRVDQLPPVPEEAGFGEGCAKLIRVLAACGKEAPGRPFAISARMVSASLGVSHGTAHEWLRGLERRGLVACPDRGKPGADGTGRARRLVWLGRPE